MSYWHGANVCITGGCGMIGRQLVRILMSRGATVTVVDDNSRGKSYLTGAAYIQADSSDSAVLSQLFYRYRPTHVFNLAATVAGVEYNSTHQFEMFSGNVGLQIAPLRACLSMKKRPKFLQVSSVCVYGMDANSPAVEPYLGTEITEANFGYSYAKRFGESAAAVARAEGLDVVIVRPTNCYGPGDYFDEKAHVIPALIRKAFNDEDIVVNCGPGVRREFIYSEDVAYGMMYALERGRSGEAYNLGSGQPVNISLLAGIIRSACGVNKSILYTETAHGVDIGRWVDSSKAKEELGWVASMPLVDGIAKTVKWYRDAD